MNILIVNNQKKSKIYKATVFRHLTTGSMVYNPEGRDKPSEVSLNNHDGFQVEIVWVMVPGMRA